MKNFEKKKRKVKKIKKFFRKFSPIFLIFLTIYLIIVTFWLYFFSDWNFEVRKKLNEEIFSLRKELKSEKLLKKEKNSENSEKIFEEFLRNFLFLSKKYPKLEKVDKISKIIAEKVIEHKNIGLTSEKIWALIEVESSGRPFAVSKAKAKGLTQFIEATATRELLKLGLPYDERYLFEPDISVLLAINHLIELRNYWLSKGKDSWAYVFHSYLAGTSPTEKKSYKDILNTDYVRKIYYELYKNGENLSIF